MHMHMHIPAGGTLPGLTSRKGTQTYCDDHGEGSKPVYLWEKRGEARGERSEPVKEGRGEGSEPVGGWEMEGASRGS